MAAAAVIVGVRTDPRDFTASPVARAVVSEPSGDRSARARGDLVSRNTTAAAAADLLAFRTDPTPDPAAAAAADAPRSWRSTPPAFNRRDRQVPGLVIIIIFLEIIKLFSGT